MAEDVSPDHLKLFPLHDDVITRTVEIDDEYRLKDECIILFGFEKKLQCSLFFQL